MRNATGSVHVAGENNTAQIRAPLPERFAKSKTVGAHFGPTPRKYGSGQIDYQGHISKCGDVLVRTALYEAGSTLLTRVQRWSALKAWGMRIAKRSGAKRARVALARKIAVILHGMWLDGTDFRVAQRRLPQDGLGRATRRED